MKRSWSRRTQNKQRFRVVLGYWSVIQYMYFFIALVKTWSTEFEEVRGCVYVLSEKSLNEFRTRQD
jgi:hypothetical protein